MVPRCWKAPAHVEIVDGEVWVEIRGDGKLKFNCMKCFYHHDRDAVGTCKSCGKGVCPECAVDLQKGLACRNRCEDEARAVIALIDQNIKISPRTAQLLDAGKSARARAATFHFVMGAIFVVWGFTDPDRFIFLIILGVCFLMFGAFSILQARRIEGQRKERT